ncbi:MAG: hypothetical protein AAF726_11070 [Planctomycetota bacterium]
MRPSQLLVLASGLALPAAAQIPAHALLRPGDVLPNGLVFERPVDMGVSDLGVWSALVEDPSGMRCVVRNGGVILSEGDVLATGATLTELIDIDVSPAGVLAIAIEFDQGGTIGASVLVEGLPLVNLGANVAGPGVPAGAELQTINEVAIAQPHVLVRGRIEWPTGSSAALVRFTFGQGNTAGDVLVLEGETTPVLGTYGSLPNGRSAIDVLPDGRALTPITIRNPGDTRDGFWFDGDVVQFDGGALPVGVGIWASSPNADAFVGQGGEVVLSGHRTTATGAPLPRAVYVDGDLYLEEGDILGARPFQPAGTAFTIDRTGRPVWAHDGGLAAGVYVDQEPVFTAIDGLVDGSGVQFVRTLGFTASASGRFVLFGGDETLATPETLLCIVETDLGVPFNACPAVPNSTGSVGTLTATGSSWVGAGPVSLVTSDLPPNSLALMLCSRTPAIIPNPGNSAGTLCLGGSIGRFFGQIGLTSATGAFEVTADPQALPLPTGFVTANAGELWGFQGWHRDSLMGSVTTNFTGTVAVLFR